MIGGLNHHAQQGHFRSRQFPRVDQLPGLAQQDGVMRRQPEQAQLRNLVGVAGRRRSGSAGAHQGHQWAGRSASVWLCAQQPRKRACRFAQHDVGHRYARSRLPTAPSVGKTPCASTSTPVGLAETPHGVAVITPTRRYPDDSIQNSTRQAPGQSRRSAGRSGLAVHCLVDDGGCHCRQRPGQHQCAGHH